MLECHFKSHFGVECPGCGFQRSFLALIQGDFAESIALFPATIPLVMTFVYTGLHLAFRFRHGARNIVWLFSTTAIVMAVSFGIKVFTNS
jgi:hypothetical protein